MASSPRCIAVLGGSFDPVHTGHVALGNYFAKLLFSDVLRIVPAGNPWQKPPLQASAEHRIAMLRLAFSALSVPVEIDDQEIRREGATYTIDTLRTIRSQVGPDVSIALLIGADQLLGLHTWREWRSLFELAHLCAASRPGFDVSQMDVEVQREFARRGAKPAQLRSTPHGLTCVAGNLAIDISATSIREALMNGRTPAHAMLPEPVLDYIQQHHLYERKTH